MKHRFLSVQNVRGFTLVELMVSTAIIGLILLVLVSITSQTSATWRYTTGKIEQFREARTAFDTMSTRLSQATLNTYWDYFDAAGKTRAGNPNFTPAKYGRQSELLFITGPASKLIGDTGAASRVTHSVFFHAPLGLVEDANNKADANFRGLNNLLNVWGYYVELRDDTELRPTFITDKISPTRTRFRLMEFMLPAQDLITYRNDLTSKKWTGWNGRASPAGAQYDWFKLEANATPAKNAPVHALAENIIALIIRPQLSKQDAEQQAKAGKKTELADNYIYDTRYDPSASEGKYNDPAVHPINQLPPILQITMVAIDEQSASRLNLTKSSKDLLVENKFTDPTKYESDLFRQGGSGMSLEDTLTERGVNYRIFSTNVPIRGAKWSKEQIN